MAVLFIAISASFYTAIDAIPGLDASSPAVRQQVQPLNPPPAALLPGQRAAINDASTSAFHLAMLVNAGLLLAGAAVNGFGLRRAGADMPAPETGRLGQEPLAKESHAGGTPG